MKKKKGVSPIIATVLLIAMVIVIGLIIFLWFRGMVEESVTKFGKNVELVCADVEFDSTYSDSTLSISNTGNVPLFGMKIEISEGGNYETKSIRELSDSWPINGLGPGDSFSESIDFGSADKITSIPVLLGTSEKGDKSFVCDGYGKEEKI
ncbi:MAG: archaellin/type IV pilin N-terminal domain-containing protein [Nanoarchaeota archaeon]